MTRQRIGRSKVISHPARIFEADEACTIMLFVPSKKLDGDGGASDNPEVVVSVDVEPVIPYGDENSAVLPFDKGFPIFLEEGQSIYVISPGESEVTFSVLPASIGVVGY